MTAEWMVSAAVAAIVNSMAAALCLAMATSAVLRLLPRVNASTRYAAWWLCLIVVTALPFVRRAEMVRRPPSAEVPRIRLVSATTGDREPRWSPAPPMVARQSISPSSDGLAQVAAAVWMIGALVCLTRLVRSYRWIRARRAASAPGEASRLAACLVRCPTRRRIELRMSGEIRTPIATGFLRPAILLPSSLTAHLDEEEMNGIVTHELAHLARRDDWVQLAERLLGALLWFHPAVRWALSAIRLEREHCCDDRVVMGGARARTYAASLVKLAEWRRGAHGLALAAAGGSGRSDMYRRVEALLRRKGDASADVSAVRLTLAGVVMALVTAATAPLTGFLVLAPPPMAAQPAPTPPAPPAAAPKASSAPQSAPKPSRPPSPAAEAPRAPTPPAPASRPTGLLGALKASGYGDLSVEEIIEIKNAGVSADYLLDLRDAGVGRMTARELVSLKQYGVGAAYVKEVFAAGGFAIRDVVEFRAHGVPASLVSAIQRLKFGPYTARQIIEFSNNGVRAEFFQMLRDNGVQQIEPRDVVEARVHGLSDSSLREARRYGPNLTFQQIIKLKRAGVI